LTTEFANNPSTSIVPAVVELAKSSSMTVVATGVETPDQLQSIIDVGCDVVQGYVFSEPRPFEDLVDKREGFKWPMPLGVKARSSKNLAAVKDFDNSTAREA
jgi:EAL domain-containing protein (putative c-di-GMP-specific phosphodiesterase class I)